MINKLIIFIVAFAAFALLLFGLDIVLQGWQGLPFFLADEAAH